MNALPFADLVPFDDRVRSTWRYPGGEVGVRAAVQPAPARLLARVHDSDELLALVMFLAAVRGQVQHVVIPYLPYARQDHVAVAGDPIAIEVLAELLATTGVRSFATVDAHSPASVAAFAKVGLALADTPATPWLARYLAPLATHAAQPVWFVAPDKGARTRTAAAAAALARPERPIGVVFCEKVRDPHTGKLQGFRVADDSPSALGRDPLVVVVDDICDGGGTFLGVAQALRAHHGALPLHLWTSHGIHSKGLDELATAFTTIGCTDSFRGRHSHPVLRIVPLLDPELRA
jgi:ribose-phosphate pyrophosphokinase